MALAGLILQLIFAGIAFLLGYWNLSIANRVEAWHLLLGVPFWLIALAQLRGRRRTDEESVEMDRLEAARRAGRERSLFEEGEAQAFVAKTRLRQLERYFVPAFSAILGLLLAGLAINMIVRVWKTGQPAGLQNQALSMAVMAGIAFFCFLVGMYAAGMARQAEWRLLRAGASYMLSCAVGAAATAVSLGVSGLLKEDRPDLWIAYAILVGLILAGAEILLNLVLDFYRPRIEGQEPRPAYDSRVFGLLAEPGGIFKTLSATLDYQFGFKISETWFYRFLERAIAPLLLFTLAAFYLLTSIVVIKPEEHAIIERFGRPRQGVTPIGPGFYLKWPWPIDKVRRYPTGRIQSLRLGHELMEKKPGEAAEEKPVTTASGRIIRIPQRKDPRAILWDQPHYKKEHLVLVGVKDVQKEPERRPDDESGDKPEEAPVPVVLLSSHVEVQYRVTRDGLHDFLYRHAEPEALLEAIGYREIIRYLADQDMMHVMSEGRQQASADLKKRIADAAKREKLGIEILFVGLQGVHPPVEGDVGKAYQEVMAAWQEQVAKVNEAEGEANKIEAETEYTRRVLLASARADSYIRETLADAEKKRFKVQMEIDDKAGIYRMREFLTAAERALPKLRKYVVAATGLISQRLFLDLKDEIKPEQWQIGYQETKPEEKKEE